MIIAFQVCTATSTCTGTTLTLTVDTLMDTLEPMDFVKDIIPMLKLPAPLLCKMILRLNSILRWNWSETSPDVWTLFQRKLRVNCVICPFVRKCGITERFNTFFWPKIKYKAASKQFVLQNHSPDMLSNPKRISLERTLLDKYLIPNHYTKSSHRSPFI